MEPRACPRSPLGGNMVKTFRFEAAAAIYFDVEAENSAQAKVMAAALIQQADTTGYDLDVDEEHNGRAYFDLMAIPEIVFQEE
jgi:hypothetical protein